MIALLIGYESVGRLFLPVPIAFGQAIPLTALGLAVNVINAWLLRADHGHDAGAVHHNLRAAYLHVVADAAASSARW
jgi:Co/Zn/Cd efflux system component